MWEITAQTLAAIQLGMRAVERELEITPSRAQLAMLRMQLAETVRTIRDIAVRLRPPALDHLGLEPALRSIAERVSSQRGFEVVMHVNDLDGRIAPYLETIAYRVIDDLVTAADEAVEVRVGYDRVGGSLRIVGAPFDRATSEKIVTRIGARLDQAVGAITVDGDSSRTIHVLIPLSESWDALPEGALPEIRGLAASE